ncbi:hypothetical protein [Streptomyces sp. 8N706]|uniref:hypothetical protein n=1 Tax=Streptomyces sp. 8N706 TaxID=3457416 RepID=UPI003FD10C1C
MVKRKMSNHRLKRPEHRHWPQPTEVGRMMREPCEGERFRRGHLLMRAQEIQRQSRS